MLIGGGKLAISTIIVGLSYEIIFIVCMLYIFFMHLRQNTILSKNPSPSPRVNHLPIFALSFWRP